LENPYRALSKINPQKEGHHREIANDVFDALISARLSGGEYQVVLSIIERSWGHQFHSKVISLGHFQKATNLSRQGAIDAVYSLEKKRIITTQRNGTKGTEYLFNKHYDTWLTSQPQFTSEPKLVKQSRLVDGGALVKQSLPDWSSRVDQTGQVELTSTSQVPEPSTEPDIESNRKIIESNIERGAKKKRTFFFPNILLTEDEYNKLVEHFGDAGTKDRLENLSLYKKSKGRRYASDYATVLAWEKRDKKEGESGAHKQRPRQIKARGSYRSPEEHRVGA